MRKPKPVMEDGWDSDVADAGTREEMLAAMRIAT
jgi:hypothetical protein